MLCVDYLNSNHEQVVWVKHNLSLLFKSSSVQHIIHTFSTSVILEALENIRIQLPHNPQSVIIFFLQLCLVVKVRFVRFRI